MRQKREKGWVEEKKKFKKNSSERSGGGKVEDTLKNRFGISQKVLEVQTRVILLVGVDKSI